ncbi:MAG: hypothetical protein JXR95_06960 [Deltaproteobacteria bacterium]|nr:hypothetical protein [Deltaproteobacteria bacterium]
MKKITLLIAVALISVTGCKSKKKTYTTPKVTAEIREDLDKIKSYRQKGELENAAKLSISLGKRITSEYPVATMYREDVAKVLGFIIRVGRLCQDKELEIKSESINPSDAKVFADFSESISEIAADIRTKLPTIPWFMKPKPKKPVVAPVNTEKKEDAALGNDKKDDTGKTKTTPEKK